MLLDKEKPTPAPTWVGPMGGRMPLTCNALPVPPFPGLSTIQAPVAGVIMLPAISWYENQRPPGFTAVMASDGVPSKSESTSDMTTPFGMEFTQNGGGPVPVVPRLSLPPPLPRE